MGRRDQDASLPSRMDRTGPRVWGCSIGLDKSNRRANVSHLPVMVLPAISSAGFELRQVAAHPVWAAHYAVFVDRSKDLAQVVNTEIVQPKPDASATGSRPVRCPAWSTSCPSSPKVPATWPSAPKPWSTPPRPAAGSLTRRRSRRPQLHQTPTRPGSPTY